MRWAELDLDRDTLELPAPTKNGLPHEVPLPRQVKEILERQDAAIPCCSATAGFSTGRATSPGSTDMLDLPVDGTRPPPDRGHRHGRDRHRPHIVEAVVNHVSGHKGGIAGVYNKAKYSQEKRAALQRWADHVEWLVSGEAAANVVSDGRMRGAPKSLNPAALLDQQNY